MTRSFVLATALFLTSAVGLSYAQSDTTTSTTTTVQQKAPAATPAAAPTPATPAPAATPAAAETPAAAPALPPGSTTTTTTTTMVPEVITGECRTRRTVGNACSCLKAPTTMGVSTASPTGGRNMCVIP